MMFSEKYFKTGLAVMLTGFFVFTCGILNAQAPPAESDSAILVRHIRETKIKYALEEFSDHSFNAHLDEAEIDSLLWENRTRVSGGRIIYAPDSAFKIVIVDCESCGGYCNPFYESWLHFSDGSQFVVNNVGFGDVVEIHKMQDGKYLVLERSAGRTATDITTSKSALLLSISNYKVTFVPFPATQTVKADTTRGAFYFENTFFNDKYGSWLTYDSLSQQLSYQYCVEIEEKIDYDYAYIYSGYFLYENGRFIHKEENRLILAD